MPIESLRKIGDKLDLIFKDLSPPQFVTKVAAIDKKVYFRYFKGFRPNKISRKRIGEICRKEIFEKENELLAQFLILMFNEEHRGVFNGMLEHVRTIDENVEDIEAIEDAKAIEFLRDLRARFDAEEIAMCVHLNDVKFSKEIIEAYVDGTEELPPPAEGGSDAPAEATDAPAEEATPDSGE